MARPMFMPLFLGAFFLATLAGVIASVAADTIPSPVGVGNDVDISAFIDDFVQSWIENLPASLSSDLDLSEVHDTAERVKDAVLNTPNSSPTQSPTSTPIPTAIPAAHLASHRRHAPFRSRLANSTLSTNTTTLDEARALVRLAQKEATMRNRERYKNPRLNNYYAHLSPKAALRARAEDVQAFTINDTVREAAALVAEAEAADQAPVDYSKYTVPAELLQFQNQQEESSPIDESQLMKKKRASGSSSFWMESIERTGRIPYGGADNNGYKVFRNVREYGAVGDGKTDDTAAIMRAMSEGGRCGANCGSSSIKGAIVYFPPGTYLISTPIIAYYHTQMIGNFNDRPVLKAAKSFTGLGLVSSDVYTGGNGGAEEWYINQSNFLRQLRNFVIDVSGTDMINAAGVHWQVAQATSIQNVQFIQSSAANTEQVGIFAENGSGGFMSGLVFWNGAVGIQCGNQQFTTRNFLFIGCRTAIQLLWDWGWTWKSIAITNSQYGIRFEGSYRGGSILLLDSYMASVTTGIYVTTPKGATASEQFSITIDNLELRDVGTAVNHKTAGVTLAGGTKVIESWMLGKVYDPANPNGKYQNGGSLASLHPKTQGLRSANGYFERDKPQYEHFDAGVFLSAFGPAKGDGVSDDTLALSLLFALAAQFSRPVFIPMGSYIVTSTVKIPVNSIIVGECWSQIVARGPAFGNMNKPTVMVQVGDEGDEGIVEIQDMLFTNEGPTAGVVLMQWNVAQTSKGSAAMWDSHFRIGGAAGSRLQAANCPKLTGKVNNACIAGSLMLHMTTQSSGYLENIWAWVADHDLDSGPAQTQIDVYVARGILIESAYGPTWLYGTSSEHCVLYQYLLYGARNVYMGMIQTESPYFLPKPQAPAPFTAQVGQFPGDPTFKDCPASNPHCAAAWGLSIVGSTNVHILGAGLYNWFQDYTQPCVDTQDCQQRVVSVSASGNVWLYNLYTIGTAEMVNLQGKSPVLAKTNTNTNEHPFTSIINAWLVASAGGGFGCEDGFCDVDGGGDDEGADDADYEIEPINLAPACTGMYRKLEHIELAAGNIPDHCVDKYIVDAELAMVDEALSSYDEVMNRGYDAKFRTFERAVRDSIQPQLDKYMKGAQAAGTFRCEALKPVTCCRDCPERPDRSNCRFVCDSGADCRTGMFLVPTDCPTEIKEPTDKSGDVDKITYRLVDEDKFYADMADKYGILKEWIVFKPRLARLGQCWMAPDAVACQKLTNVYWQDFPTKADMIDVPNPKALIDEAYASYGALSRRLAVETRLAPFSLDASRADLVDTASMPALMLQQAIESMNKVVTTASKIEEEERKAAILNFLIIGIMLIPGAGQLAGQFGFAWLRTMIGLVAEIGNGAITIYQLTQADDVGEAFMTLFLYVLGGGTSRAPFKETAAAVRAIRSGDRDKMPPRIKNGLAQIMGLRQTCLKK